MAVTGGGWAVGLERSEWIPELLWRWSQQDLRGGARASEGGCRG